MFESNSVTPSDEAHAMAGLTPGGEEKRSAQDGTGQDSYSYSAVDACTRAGAQAKYYPPSFHYRQVPGPVHHPC